MTFRTILFDVTKGVASITLNRPEVRNAFGDGMGDELSEAFRRCDDDDDIRAVVLTGTPPAFCAGADLSSGADTFRPRDTSTFSSEGVSFPAWKVRKPVIAAVNGHAIGIGLTLTLHCDLRLFAKDAKYGIVQARRGMLGDAMSHWTLPRIAGFATAADVLLTGRTFDGSEAHRMGLCSEVLPNDDILDRARAIAHDIAVNVAPASAAASKVALWRSWGMSADEMNSLETHLHHKLMALDDAREGVRAFMEKRTPHWTGTPDMIND
jgi:enoyl-CoA hydratase/carnithine racemase